MTVSARIPAHSALDPRRDGRRPRGRPPIQVGADPAGRDTIDALSVFLAALATALATGLGALPLLAARSAGRGALGMANGVAAGVMLGASLTLLVEGGDRSVWRTAAGALAGAAFVELAERFLSRHHRGPIVLGSLRGEDAVKGLLIVAVMTVHSAAEGIGVGAAFGGGAELGLLIAVAIAIHNIPEGLAISLVLVPRGASVGAAAGWSIFSSLPQPLLAVPAFLFVETFEGILPVGLGFAAGAMAWLVARELLPEALSQAPARTVAGTTAVAFVGMALFQLLLL
ncbi:MAG TPA: ZIP family metal transporter [Gaiellaceae bacterium]